MATIEAMEKGEADARARLDREIATAETRIAAALAEAEARGYARGLEDTTEWLFRISAVSSSTVLLVRRALLKPKGEAK